MHDHLATTLLFIADLIGQKTAMFKTRLILLFMLLMPAPLAAGPYDEVASVEILPGWRTADQGHVAGLRISLAPGWKTYWRAPGDAGIPPQFIFDGSTNIAFAKPHWPVPEVFDQNGVSSIGYDDSVVFPIMLTPQNPGEPIQLRGQIDIGICEEICIPKTFSFDMILPVTGERDAAITAAMVNQPYSAEEANVGTVTCVIDPSEYGLRLTTVVNVDRFAAKEFVVIEAGNDAVWVSPANVTRDGKKLYASVDMIHGDGDSFALDRSKVRITVLGNNEAIDIHGCSAG